MSVNGLEVGGMEHYIVCICIFFEHACPFCLPSVCIFVLLYFVCCCIDGVVPLCCLYTHFYDWLIVFAVHVEREIHVRDVLTNCALLTVMH